MTIFLFRPILHPYRAVKTVSRFLFRVFRGFEVSGEKDYQDDDLDDDDLEEGSLKASAKESVTSNLESRRRLEEALEQRRLQKAIQDYDFDLD